jgi:mannosyltransferase
VITWLVPALLTLAIGVWGLGRQAWRDEHATWQAATMSWPELTSRLSHVDIVFAPYYFFMRGWIAVFGDSVVAMRIPSLLAMAATAGLVGLLGERLFPHRSLTLGPRHAVESDPGPMIDARAGAGVGVGVVAGCLFAVVPSVSRYAQEARSYPFAIGFAVASVLAVLWATAKPSWRRWGLVSLAIAGAGLSHLVALLIVLAHIPLVRGHRRQWLAAVGIGLIPVLPPAIIGARQTGQVDWIDSSLSSLATLPFSLARSAAVAGILAALAIVGIAGRPWDRRITALVIWAAAPPIVLFGLAPGLFYYRYLLFTLPAWVLLAALALRRRAAAVAVVGAVLLLGARDHLAVRRDPLPGDQDYRSAAAYVAEHMQATDSIKFSGYADRRERLGFAYELRGRPMPRECEICAGPRLWLVSNNPQATVDGFERLESRSFPGITVGLYQGLRPTPK